MSPADRRALYHVIEPLLRYQAGEARSRKQLTHHILANMDATSDPCRDFYRFSCGGWLRHNAIPPDQSVWGTLDQLQRENNDKLARRFQALDVSDLDHASAIWKAKTTFDQCLNDARTDARTPALLRQMTWQLISTNDERGREDRMSEAYYEQKTLGAWDFNAALIRAHRFHGSKAFFDFFPFSDHYDPKRRVLKFEEAGLPYSDPTEMKNENKTIPYRDLIRGVTQEALQLKDDDAQRFARNVLKLEKKLAEIYVKPEEKTDSGRTFHKVNFSRLFDGQPENHEEDDRRPKSQFSPFPSRMKIDWFQLLASHNVSNFTLDSFVAVSNQNYFTNLNRLLASTDPEWVRDYIVWTCLNVELDTLPSTLRARYRDYKRRVYGKKTAHPPLIRCLKVVSKMFPFTVSRIYQNASFPESHKRYVTSLVEFLQTTLLLRVPELTWMDEGTKNRTREKIVAMVMNLGYPNFVVNATELDEAVDDILVDADETLWKTFQKYLAVDVTDYDRLLKGNRSRFGWSYADVSEVNAGYKAASNNLEFPAGILQRPIFHPTYPKFWNFGSVASIIGHEMSHGFDASGSQFDGEGRQVNWWSPESLANFRASGRCMAQFYSRYRVEGIAVNGNLTLDENIADVGGLKLAFRAFLKWKEIASLFRAEEGKGGGGGGGGGKNGAWDEEERQGKEGGEGVGGKGWDEGKRRGKKGRRKKQRLRSVAGRGGGGADSAAIPPPPTYPLAGIDLTDEQLFFVAFGQTWCERARRQTRLDSVKSWEHCPQPVRTEAALALIPDFARAFQCPPNSTMNPSRRCDLW